MIKAYKAWDEYSSEGYSTVVFAESASKAKMIALYSDACEDANTQISECNGSRKWTSTIAGIRRLIGIIRRIERLSSPLAGPATTRRHGNAPLARRLILRRRYFPMTEKDLEIQELRRKVARLEKENARLEKQHQLDQSEIVSIRRRYECRCQRIEEGEA